VPALEPELLGVRTGAGGAVRPTRHDHMLVASVGRNDPCPCGSGPKAKRCCGVAREPSEESEAHAFLVHASRDAAATLRSRSDRELLDLFDGLWDLRQTDISLQAELPKVFSPELSRLCEVVLDKSADGPLLDAVTQQLDTPFSGRGSPAR